MSSPVPSEFPQIQVTPNDLFLMDVQTNLSSDWFFRFKPLDYDVTITLSGFVITRLLQWAINNGFILIEGQYTILDGRKRRTLNGQAKKEDFKAQDGAMLPTPSKER